RQRQMCIRASSGTVAQRLGLVLRGAERTADGGVINDERFGRLRIIGGKVDVISTKVYIDGFKATQEEFLRMPPENISRIELYNSGLGLGIPVSSSADYLFVTTKQIAKINNYTLSMKSVKPLGYKQSCEFYHPQYESRILTVPDYRITYYWNPRLQATSDNKWSFSCLVPSMTKKVLLTIEGVGENGRIVSETKIITM
ncbi:MAG: hypothetical protein K2I86_00815, partial [Prevotella sp.]|nr:hypothetical protein [Prevotella sp.]